ncbi:MAG: hypothetical protein ACRC37_04700, partial [Lentisphaeria bacterium]
HLGSDLDEEERESAIRYASETNFDDHSGKLCFSYINGLLGGIKTGIFASAYELDKVLEFIEEIDKQKMQFLGILNYSQLLIADHFSYAENSGKAFLLLLENSGCIAIKERNKIIIRNLPFGISNSDSDDWSSKAQRRLSLLSSKEVRVYSEHANDDFTFRLKQLIDASSVEVVNWVNSLCNSAIYFIKDGYKILKLANLPPKAKDPKAQGTILGIGILVVVISVMLIMATKNMVELQKLENIHAKNRSFDQQIKSEENRIKKLTSDISLERELNTLITNDQRLSENFVLIVNLLSRYPLEYTKINSITEQKNGIVIEGETVWQADLSKFFAHFNNRLKRHNLALFSDRLTQRADGKIIFQAHIKEVSK